MRLSTYGPDQARQRAHLPLATVKPDTDIIITSSKTLMAIEPEKVNSSRVAIMTTFLSALLGAGADVGVDIERR